MTRASRAGSGTRYGYAVFPSVGKGGIGIGGARGKGLVYEKGALIGKVTLTQVTVGLQLGGQSFSEVLIATLGFFAAPAFAQGGSDELWDMTTRMEMAGMPGQSFTNQVCMKKGQTQPDKMSHDKNCKVAEMRTMGSKTTWKIVCAGRDPVTGEGEITRTKDSMNGRMRMQGKQGNESYDMTTVMSGRLVGSCDAEAQNRQMQAMAAQGSALLAQQCKESMDKYMTLMFDGQWAPCAAQKAEY